MVIINNFSHDAETFVFATKKCNLENMKWLLKNNFGHNSRTFASDTENDN
jgi:hypothetical protein